MFVGLQADKLHVKDGAENIDHIIQVGGRNEIADVKGLERHALVLATVFLIVSGNNRLIAGHRRPESLEHFTDNGSCGIEINIIQVHLNVSAIQVLVKTHENAELLPNLGIN